LFGELKRVNQNVEPLACFPLGDHSALPAKFSFDGGRTPLPLAFNVSAIFAALE
jgi:hypothetical protein